MIQTIVGRLKRRLQFGKIHDPTGMRINFTGDLKTHHERMPVQTAAFMPFRDMRKVVGGFEGEIFKQCGGHDRSQ